MCLHFLLVNMIAENLQTTEIIPLPTAIGKSCALLPDTDKLAKHSYTPPSSAWMFVTVMLPACNAYRGDEKFNWLLFSNQKYSTFAPSMLMPHGMIMVLFCTTVLLAGWYRTSG